MVVDVALWLVGAIAIGLAAGVALGFIAVCLDDWL